MAMVMDTDMAMAVMDTAMDTATAMARGRLRHLLMPSPAMATTVTAMATDMAMAAMDTAMDTATATARGRLRLLPLLSPAMDTTVTAMDMVMDMDMDMAMAMEAMVIMDMVVMDTTATDMAMATATTDKFLLLFSAVESSVQTKNLDHLVLVLNFKILNK